jgi:hypothetical protein
LPTVVFGIASSRAIKAKSDRSTTVSYNIKQ